MDCVDRRVWQTILLVGFAFFATTVSGLQHFEAAEIILHRSLANELPGRVRTAICSNVGINMIPISSRYVGCRSQKSPLLVDTDY